MTARDDPDAPAVSRTVPQPPVLQQDWDQFRMLQRGSVRRFLNTITGSPDADPIPFVIWATALALTPPLLTAIRTAFRLSMTGDAAPQVIFGFIQTFRVFFVVYAMLMALLLTALIWDALLPDRDDQDIVGSLPVRPLVLAASRLSAGCHVLLALALALAVPVALLFGLASASQPGVGSIPRVLFAHVVSTVCASSSVFFSLVTIRAAAAAAGGERLADHLASLLQFVAILVFVETSLFLPGVLFDLMRVMRTPAAVPIWYQLPLSFAALYGWLAEGGPRTPAVNVALLATLLPAVSAVALSLLPAAAVARHVQERLPSRRASLLTSIVRRLLHAGTWNTAVRGMTVFAAATLTRSRRHAAIVASYAALAFAMAVVELLTAGFTDHFSLAAPRRDNLAVPLVCLFFAVFGLRAAMMRPADPGANWPFRIASPRVCDSRTAAWLIIVWCGALPILITTLLIALSIWPMAVALRVVMFDIAAAALLTEFALLNWTLVPCAAAQVTAADAVKSKWPLQVLGLYLFAFRGADMEMLALGHAQGIAIAVGLMLATIVALRVRQAITSPNAESSLDALSDDPLLMLRLSESDA
jgi:hypothetical protein